MNIPHRFRLGLISLLFSIFGAVLLAAAESRVYVQFSPGAKAEILTSVNRAGGRLHYAFDDLHAVAVSLPEQALAGLSRNPNVTLVEPDPVRQLFGQTTPYGIAMVQATEAVAAGATGSGITVGVIDSGVFTGHEDFAGVQLAGEPGGNPATSELAWNRDRDSHGTHVTGTIVAANNSLGVIGVSPGATRIYMVKVFGDSGTWIYSSTLLQAVRNAVNNGGARIISMSLGGSSSSKTEENGLKQIDAQGALLVAAAGNDGSRRKSYPASYASVISVAAIDSTKTHASFSQENSEVELAAPGVGVLSTVSYRSGALTVGGTGYIASSLEGTTQASASAPLVDGGRAAATNAAWSGKTVLVERGDLSFADKVRNVQDSGGAAVVIYNNVDGGFSGTLSPFTSSIPAVSVTQADGLDLLGRLGSTATVSTVAAIDASGYDYFDGTSMATPHVSGVAALIWSKYPGATNAQVRQALQETTEDLGPAGRDISYGFGLVQAKAALDRLETLVGGSPPPPPPPGDDVTAPVITSGPSAVITNTKNGMFEISWTTDEAASSDVRLNGADYLNGTLTTAHVIKFKGTKGATYTYYVRSADAAGNSTGWVGPFTHNN